MTEPLAAIGVVMGFAGLVIGGIGIVLFLHMLVGVIFRPSKRHFDD